MDRTALYRRILRTSFNPFMEKCFLSLEPATPYQDNWHVQAIAHALEGVNRGETTRLIINIPPRYMKSIAVTVAFTAFVMGHDPARRILALSYARELSAKHAADFRTIIESPWYQSVFPELRMQARRNRNVEMVTTDKDTGSQARSAARCLAAAPI